MTFRVALLGLILLAAANGYPAGRPSSTNAIQATVCELVSKPADFVGRSVTFHALVQSDGEHLALLLDASCQRGLRFSLKSALPLDSAKAISEAALGVDGSFGKDVQADFTATLKPSDQTGMFPKPLPYFLDVTEIRGVGIKNAKAAEKHD